MANSWTSDSDRHPNDPIALDPRARTAPHRFSIDATPRLGRPLQRAVYALHARVTHADQGIVDGLDHRQGARYANLTHSASSPLVGIDHSLPRERPGGSACSGNEKSDVVVSANGSMCFAK
jgi:hypothetical protein